MICKPMKPWKRPHFVSSITTAKLKYIHFYNVFSYKIFKQELLTNGWIERHQDSTSSNRQHCLCLRTNANKSKKWRSIWLCHIHRKITKETHMAVWTTWFCLEITGALRGQMQPLLHELYWKHKDSRMYAPRLWCRYSLSPIMLLWHSFILNNIVGLTVPFNTSQVI